MVLFGGRIMLILPSSFVTVSRISRYPSCLEIDTTFSLFMSPMYGLLILWLSLTKFYFDSYEYNFLSVIVEVGVVSTSSSCVVTNETVLLSWIFALLTMVN